MDRVRKSLIRICDIFTLIEMLVVVAIIAVLISILLPALHKAKGLGKRAVRVNNLKQLYCAANYYMNDYDEYLPGGTQYNNFNQLIPDYINSQAKKVATSYAWRSLSGPLSCPSVKRAGNSPSWHDQCFPSYSGTKAIYLLPGSSVKDIPYRQWGGWNTACCYSDWSKVEGAARSKRITQVTDNRVIASEQGFSRSSWSTVYVADTLRANDAKSWLNILPEFTSLVASR